MNPHEQPHDDQQLGAYALGALDPEDRAEVEQYLAQQPAHQEELRQLREVVALLPYSVQPVAPPSRVREALMARVAASAHPKPVSSTHAVAPKARARTPWLRAVFAAALLVAIGGLAGLGLSLNATVASQQRTNFELGAALANLQNQLEETRNRQDELAAELASSKAELAQVSSELESSQARIGELRAELAQDDYVLSFVSAPGVATRELSPAARELAARGEMYMYPGQSTAVVLFSGLPALEPGQVYQFWLADGTTQVAGDTFVVDHSGIGHIIVRAPREVNAFSQVMITVEPEGGSVAPSEAVVLEGSL